MRCGKLVAVVLLSGTGAACGATSAVDAIASGGMWSAAPEGGSRSAVSTSASGASTQRVDATGRCTAYEGFAASARGGRSVDAVALRPRRVSLVFAIDRSESLREPVALVGMTRWEVLTEALMFLLEELVDVPDLSVGLSLFPDPSVTTDCEGRECCSVDTDEMTVDPAPIAAIAPTIFRALRGVEPAGRPAASAAISRALAGNRASTDTDQGLNAVVVILDNPPLCGNTRFDDMLCDLDHCLLNVRRACDTYATENCCNSEPASAWCWDEEDFVDWLDAQYMPHPRMPFVRLPGTQAFPQMFAGFTWVMYDVEPNSGASDWARVLRASVEPVLGHCTSLLPGGWPATDVLEVAVDCTVIPKDAWTAEPDQLHEDRAQVSILGDWCTAIIPSVTRVDVLRASPAG